MFGASLQTLCNLHLTVQHFILHYTWLWGLICLWVCWSVMCRELKICYLIMWERTVYNIYWIIILFAEEMCKMYEKYASSNNYKSFNTYKKHENPCIVLHVYKYTWFYYFWFCEKLLSVIICLNNVFNSQIGKKILWQLSWF